MQANVLVIIMVIVLMFPTIWEDSPPQQELSTWIFRDLSYNVRDLNANPKSESPHQCVGLMHLCWMTGLHTYTPSHTYKSSLPLGDQRLEMTSLQWGNDISSCVMWPKASRSQTTTRQRYVASSGDKPRSNLQVQPSLQLRTQPQSSS